MGVGQLERTVGPPFSWYISNGKPFEEPLFLRNAQWAGVNMGILDLKMAALENGVPPKAHSHRLKWAKHLGPKFHMEQSVYGQYSKESIRFWYQNAGHDV